MRLVAPDDVYIAALDRYVAAGDEVEVPAEIGDSLVDQGWPEVDEHAPREKAGKASTNEREA